MPEKTPTSTPVPLGTDVPTPAGSTPAAPTPAASAPIATTAAVAEIEGISVCVAPYQDHAPLKITDFQSSPQAIQDFLSGGATPDELQQALQGANIANEPVAVLSGDMTGDGKMNWPYRSLTHFSNLPPAGFPLIFNCQNQYVLALNQADEGGPHLWFMQDLDADGRADLVDSSEVCGAHTCFETARIRSWDGSAFANRLEGTTQERPYPEIDIQDPEGDGIFQLEVTGTGFGSVGAGPSPGITWIWTFDPGYWAWKKTGEILGESNDRNVSLFAHKLPASARPTAA
jgi:hypothetical protein